MATTTLVNPTTAAVASGDSGVVRTGQARITISADNLAGAEQVAIEYSHSRTGAWFPAQNSDGDIILTAAKAQAVMRGAGYYRVSKDATAGACGVYVVS